MVTKSHTVQKNTEFRFPIGEGKPMRKIAALIMILSNLKLGKKLVTL